MRMSVSVTGSAVKDQPAGVTSPDSLPTVSAFVRQTKRVQAPKIPCVFSVRVATPRATLRRSLSGGRTWPKSVTSRSRRPRPHPRVRRKLPQKGRPLRPSPARVPQRRRPGPSLAPAQLGSLRRRLAASRCPPRPPDPNVNFFDTNRAGHPVVRPDDLVALRIELHNLTVAPGTPPRLRKRARRRASGHPFPAAGDHRGDLLRNQAQRARRPPAAAQRRTRQARAAGGSEELTGPPIRARISGESRLVFGVPDGFDIDYTLKGVLAAIETLALAVPANAKPPAPARHRFASPTSSVLSSRPCTRPNARCSPALRLAACASPRCRATRRRSRCGRRWGARSSRNVNAQNRSEPRHRRHRADRTAARRPGARQTAIELPWRLILSPHSAERWRHAKAPVTSPAGHTELWHSRLVAPRPEGHRHRAAASRPAAHACARSGR